MRQVPTTADELLYEQVTPLDGADYRLTFAFNLREGRWYLDLSDADGVLIVASLVLVINRDLLRRVQDERRPPGKLFCVDLTGQGKDPDQSAAPVLYYLEAAEL